MKFNKGWLAALVLVSAQAHAFGKSQTTPTQPTVTPANPARAVVLDSVSTVPFPLPNGTTVDLTSELNTMLNTAVTGTSTLVPTVGETSSGTGCDTHVELRAAVTTLQMNLTQLGLTVGYTPVGVSSVGAISSASGSVNVTVGEIGMDFSLWVCTNGECQSVAASSADQSSVQTTLSFSIDFGTITTGAQLVNNTALGDTLRAILTNGIAQLAASSKISTLPWSATVMAVNSSAGTFTFNQGADSLIGMNQDFVVYAAVPGEGACAVYQALAYGQTSEVDPVSSVATITQSLDSSRPVEVGDVVMVKASE